MKVALVSTHPPRQCGIAAYTHKLSAALVNGSDRVRPEILSEWGGEEVVSGIPCEPCFGRSEDFGPKIADAAARRGVEIAHFQHAPDIFGVGGRMLKAADLLRRKGIFAVVTLHTVFTRTSGLIELEPFASLFHRRLGRLVDGIIVHSETCRGILEAHGAPAARIEVIPHGTDEPLRGNPRVGRKILGLERDARVLLFFGFLHMQKNIHMLLKAMTIVVKSAPDAVLAIVGKPGGDTWYNRLYVSWVKGMVVRRGLTKNAVVLDRFVTDEEAADIHAASMAVLLPHSQGYGFASGVVHNAMSMGLPLICSRSAKFEEVASSISSGAVVPTFDPRTWAEKILILLEDDNWSERMVTRVERYARETRWSAIASRHADFYRRIAGGPLSGDGVDR